MMPIENWADLISQDCLQGVVKRSGCITYDIKSNRHNTSGDSRISTADYSASIVLTYQLPDNS